MCNHLKLISLNGSLVIVSVTSRKICEGHIIWVDAHGISKRLGLLENALVTEPNPHVQLMTHDFRFVQ